MQLGRGRTLGAELSPIHLNLISCPRQILSLSMTRFRFDQFSKQYLGELLTPLGEVTIGKELLGEARQIDVWFVPNPQSKVEPDLGLLGRLSATPCLFEPYRSPPKPSEIRDCLLKLFLTLSEFQRQSKRDDARLNDAILPRLWILASSASKNLLQGFSTHKDEQNWGSGIYFLGEYIRAAIIAINQLPETQDTLWLRLLGKDRTQYRAISELIALPQKNNPFRSRALELLASWRITIETSGLRDVEAQELIMQLSPAYIKWREETLQEGQQEGEARIVLRLLARQLGELSPGMRSQIQSLSLSQLDALGDALLDFSQPSDLEGWLRSHS
jgi:Domain of unknown function (DUF4351)